MSQFWLLAEVERSLFRTIAVTCLSTFLNHQSSFSRQSFTQLHRIDASNALTFVGRHTLKIRHINFFLAFTTQKI